MIPVEFALERFDDPWEFLEDHRKSMPWLDFLCEHSHNVDMDSYYRDDTMLCYTCFKFEIEPSLETRYRLQFSY